MDKQSIFSEVERRKLLEAMKPGIYRALHGRGLLTGEQLDKLLSGNPKGKEY